MDSSSGKLRGNKKDSSSLNNSVIKNTPSQLDHFQLLGAFISDKIQFLLPIQLLIMLQKFLYLLLLVFPENRVRFPYL